MNIQRLNTKLLAMLLACTLMPFALNSCGDDDDTAPSGQQQGEETSGGGSSKNARALTVSIDESGLTYEDLTIHLSNGTDYVYENAPFGTVSVSIEDLPTSVEELQKLKLPNGMTSILQSPYLQPILLVAALNQLNYDKAEAKRMVDYVAKAVNSENRDAQLVHFPGDGAATSYPTEWSQVMQYKDFNKVRSYLEGAKYANNYTPEQKPYVMKINLTDYSYTVDKDYVQLWLTSTQLSSPTPLGIWKYDANGDGAFDTFWASSFLSLLHSIAQY